MKPSYVRSVGTVLVLLVLVGCGASGAGSGRGATGETDGGTAQRITVAGSSTVYPLTYRIAYGVESNGLASDITIANVGTGAGFRAFCGGQVVDIVNASRPISAEEQEQCATNGRTPVPFQVGYDALTVAISKQNTFVTDLSVEQLEQIFSGSITTWQQVDPQYPAEPIELYSPGTDSGTFDYFVQVVFTGDDTRLSTSAKTSEDDDVLVDGIATSPYAIGYFGYAYYQFNDDDLRAVPIRRSATDAPVSPPDDTVAESQYPFIRPLFIYSAVETIRAKPHVQQFIRFYLDHVNTVILSVGYFPVEKDMLIQAKQTLARLRG